jgi:uncharacterized protein (DUF433 family)
VPGRVGGRPVLKGTRMPVDDIVANNEYGVAPAEIARQFRIDLEVVLEILKFVERHDTIGRSAR